MVGWPSSGWLTSVHHPFYHTLHHDGPEVGQMTLQHCIGVTDIFWVVHFSAVAPLI
jgi:hypothetical protein